MAELPAKLAVQMLRELSRPARNAPQHSSFRFLACRQQAAGLRVRVRDLGFRFLARRQQVAGLRPPLASAASLAAEPGPSACDCLKAYVATGELHTWYHVRPRDRRFAARSIGHLHRPAGLYHIQ